ncbi:hypothetical protein HLH26_08265 [Gluconacetobacter sp. 1b LMG 1731]|uniref:Uncharacterized protein n=1 Tax=Gluconacetobacter dulcium TaxID=2729096 RepID=A0A7W4NVK9_9PROT|nr:hypothetical protein [Gluconacetobacter dulcium]MBB2164535.1 hypothetical protein [Gluconacetobacter dulcium]MBB2193698.1 hypothetical protein [Gluconacetobacter dulcium]
MSDLIKRDRTERTLLRFPVERRTTPTAEQIRNLLPEYGTVYNLLARHGLGAPPEPTAVEAQGRRTGMKMLGDITLHPDPQTAREEVTRWFQPLVERMVRRFSELRDLTWEAERQTRDEMWNEAYQARVASTTMIAWRTGTRLLAAWSVLDEALIAHAGASMGHIEQQATR